MSTTSLAHPLLPLVTRNLPHDGSKKGELRLAGRLKWKVLWLLMPILRADPFPPLLTPKLPHDGSKNGNTTPNQQTSASTPKPTHWPTYQPLPGPTPQLIGSPVTSTVPTLGLGVEAFILVDADTNQDIPGALECTPM